MIGSRFALGVLALLLLAGCLFNNTRQMRPGDRTVPRDRAVIMFGFADDRFADGQSNGFIRFDEFSLEEGKITGNCFSYVHMKADSGGTPGEMKYSIFSAPAGHYVLSPFGQSSSDPDASFHAPAGVITYLGDFLETGGEAPYWLGQVSRAENLPAAAAFADSRGLPGPRLAETTPIPSRGTIFLCTP